MWCAGFRDRARPVELAWSFSYFVSQGRGLRAVGQDPATVPRLPEARQLDIVTDFVVACNMQSQTGATRRLGALTQLFTRAFAATALALALAVCTVPHVSAAQNLCVNEHQGRCHAVLQSQSEDIYQGSANQAWVCQTVTAPAQGLVVQGLWAVTGNQSWVEMGITTGLMHTSSGRGTASREWYAARYSASGNWYSEYMIDAPKPNRSTDYITTIRYNGADWLLFHGNHQVLRYEGPDEGRVRWLDTGGEITDSNYQSTGRSGNLRHQRWGESTIRSGWPGTTSNISPHLAATYSGGVLNHWNPNATTSCI